MENKCSECDRSVYARGVCRKHYKRLLKYGDAKCGRAFNGDQIAFLVALLDKRSDNCVEWPFYRYKDGYGRVRFSGGTKGAHRVMAELTHGPAPNGAQAAHSCGNRSCVNPRHLRWATAVENMADAKRHETLKGGGRPTKFTAEQVAEIRRRRRTETVASLAKEFGTSKGYISNICSGRYWSHMKIPE